MLAQLASISVEKGPKQFWVSNRKPINSKNNTFFFYSKVLHIHFVGAVNGIRINLKTWHERQKD